MPKFHDLSSDILCYIFSSYLLRPYLSKEVLSICDNSKIYNNMKLFNVFSQNLYEFPVMSFQFYVDGCYHTDNICSFTKILYYKGCLFRGIGFRNSGELNVGINPNNGEFLYIDKLHKWQSLPILHLFNDNKEYFNYKKVSLQNVQIP